jgi:membrane fusion protein, multidrug efflux system
MTKRMIIMLLLAGLVFGAVFGMKWFGNQMMVQYIENMPIPPVTITTANGQDMTWDNETAAVGTLVPVQGADISTEVGGIVTAIHFESGDRVEKGARLVTLDSDTERGELLRLKAQAELAELNRERRKKLFDLEAISKADYDAAVAEADAAKAAVQSQSARLAQKDLRAPFGGQLGIRQVSVGQFINAGAPVVTLQSLDPVDVDFALPEQYLSQISAGLPVRVKVEAYPDDVFEGTVLAVEPRVDPATRNVRLRARLPNPDLKLRAGQYGDVMLRLPGSQQVLALPRTAINYSSYGSSVFVVKGDREAAQQEGGEPLTVTQRFVRLGPARGDFVAIVDGLETTDEVATSGLLKLRNDQPVIINNDISMAPELAPTPPNT